MNIVLLLESLCKLPLETHSSKNCRDKLFERKFCYQGKDIIIQEDYTGDVGEIVWEMCLLMIQYCVQIKCHFKGKKVLELGAGTGLLSIVLGLLGATVYATDIDPVIQLLQKNIDRAKQMYNEQLNDLLFARELDWFKPIPPDLNGPWDYIIMAEVVYDPTLFSPLIETLINLHGTTLLLGYEWRHRSDIGFFDLLLKKHFRTEEIPRHMYRCEGGIEPRSDHALYKLTHNNNNNNNRLLYYCMLNKI